MVNSTHGPRFGRRARALVGGVALAGALVAGVAQTHAAPSSSRAAALPAAVVAQDHGPNEPHTNAITTAAVNQRSGPGTTYPVQQVIPANSIVFVIAGPTSGNWYTVSYNNQVGSVAGAYLQQGPNEPHTNGTTTAAVNLRTGPGTSYAVQQVIPAGATVFVQAGPTNGWYTVTYNGVGGYVASAYVRVPYSGGHNH